MRSSIRFQGSITVKNSEDGRLEALLNPTGMTVYGRTTEEVEKAAEDAFKFFLQSFTELPDPFESLKRYLEKHSIEFTVEEMDLPTGLVGPVVMSSDDHRSKLMPMAASLVPA